MNELVAFITNHWVLSALFTMLLVGFFINEAVQQKIQAPRINAEQAVQLINHQEARVLDLRSESLFSAGHILGALPFSASVLEKKLETLQKHINKPLIVVCALGQESPKVALQLRDKGFQTVVLNGGIQAWKEAGLPLVKA